MIKRLKTPQEVRAEFERVGRSYADFAREHKVNASLLAAVASGKRKCLRGQSHKIAVLLGLKDGEIVQ